MAPHPTDHHFAVIVRYTGQSGTSPHWYYFDKFGHRHRAHANSPDADHRLAFPPRNQATPYHQKSSILTSPDHFESRADANFQIGRQFFAQSDALSHRLLKPSKNHAADPPTESRRDHFPLTQTSATAIQPLKEYLGGDYQ